MNIKQRSAKKGKSNPGEYDYDLIVIGCGPAGQRGAIQAAKLRKKVAIIDHRSVVGGVCVNTGTIPSKSFKEAVVYLSGYRQRSIYGAGYTVKSDIEMSDLTFRCDYIMQAEINIITSQLKRNHVEVVFGHARFVDPHTVEIQTPDGSILKSSDKFLIATGARPHQPDNIEINGRNIFNSDDILNLSQLPRAMTVVGGGVIGAEYASMFAALGVDVTIIDARRRLLPFVDQEIIDCFQYHLRSMGVTLRLGEEVESCITREDGQVVTTLKSGKVVVTDVVLISAGRQAATDDLGLDIIGLSVEERGRLEVNATYQTSIPHIHAAGDVIGFPALASTSGDQGRLAVCGAFNIPGKTREVPLPYGIYSIPEISMIGPTEETLTQLGVPYEIGIARYREIARGQLIGDVNGMLKIIFNRETQQLLATHVIGESATELVHIGQSVIALGGGLEYLLDAVFNYPTLAECYKVAALDGFNKVRTQKL
ncbi:MAG: Si-specific NAD(P)(+) transhydrogenase [Bdellovibrionales bacterium]|nr:Si-specific NAD(P)(+) transhydrogenase [Bdellovibrionales bacterium]